MDEKDMEFKQPFHKLVLLWMTGRRNEEFIQKEKTERTNIKKNLHGHQMLLGSKGLGAIPKTSMHVSLYSVRLKGDAWNIVSLPPAPIRITISVRVWKTYWPYSRQEIILQNKTLL